MNEVLWSVETVRRETLEDLETGESYYVWKAVGRAKDGAEVSGYGDTALGAMRKCAELIRERDGEDRT